MIGSYLDNRKMYDTEDGPQHYRVIGGVPQGLVLEPLLWNPMYDELLRVKLPQGAEMVAFADDVRLLIVAKFLKEVSIFEDSYDAAQEWMFLASLS